MRILVTGSAGFIGGALSISLLAKDHKVIGIDNLNDYYDPGFKRARLATFREHRNYTHIHGSIADRELMHEVFANHRPQRVVHLAAQAGVRHSIKDPYAYVDSNLVGFLNILEGCRHHRVEHLVYASSSSVYGGNITMPYSTRDSVDHPLSLYAATKKANELMAHSYSHLYGIPATGLRFFTVYGPWNRPDMATYSFAQAIMAGKPIDVFNHGNHRRDFTYIDDIIAGVELALAKIPEPHPDAAPEDPGRSRSAPFRVYNIGNNRPVELQRYIQVLEDSLGRKAVKNMREMQPGDVAETYADIDDFSAETGYTTTTNIEQGLPRFAKWFLEYHALCA